MTAVTPRRSSPPAATAARVAAWLLAGLVLVLLAMCAWLTYLTGDLQVSFCGTAMSALIFAAVGVVVARRQPANPIGWLLGVCGVLVFLLGVAELYAVLDYRIHHGTLPLGRVAVLAEASAFLVAVFFGLAVLLFPDESSRHAGGGRCCGSTSARARSSWPTSSSASPPCSPCGTCGSI